MAALGTAKQKTFSIILATYNCGQKVENTLRSILSQDKELFELIVMDGASTDGTLGFIRKYENDLSLISEKDGGVYQAFNKGIDLAKGKYIYFIGAGDCLRPGILEQVKGHLPNVSPAFVYGSSYLMKQKVVWMDKEFKISNFFCENICHQSIFYHRSIFDILGKFDTKYKICADWFFNVKCFAHREISKLYIPYVIAEFEEGGLSSELENDPEFIKDFPLLLKKYLGTGTYLKRKAFMLNPAAFAFGYKIRSALIERLISLARPGVAYYRNLKRTAKK
ncbi:MAG: glycosyltransferase family 2 protein [Pyrinomonadaceae bacterium]